MPHTFNAGITIGFLAGAFVTVAVLFVLGACQAAGEADDAIERTAPHLRLEEELSLAKERIEQLEDQDPSIGLFHRRGESRAVALVATAACRLASYLREDRPIAPAVFIDPEREILRQRMRGWLQADALRRVDEGESDEALWSALYPSPRIVNDG